MNITKYMSTLPVYSNNAEAKAGGVLLGGLYRTSDGVVMVRY